MLLYFRFLLMGLRALFQKRIEVGAKSVLITRVLPTDVDSRNANAAAFFKYMDLGQWQNLMLNGFVKLALKRGWGPVGRTNLIWYHKRLPLFKKIRIESRVCYWDEKYFYWKNEIFDHENQLAATGYTKVQVRGKGVGGIPSMTVMEAMNLTDLRPPGIPPEIRSRLETPKSENGEREIVIPKL